MQSERIVIEPNRTAFDWASMWTSNHRGQLVRVVIVASVLLLGVEVAHRFTSHTTDQTTAESANFAAQATATAAPTEIAPDHRAEQPTEPTPQSVSIATAASSDSTTSPAPVTTVEKSDVKADTAQQSDREIAKQPESQPSPVHVDAATSEPAKESKPARTRSLREVLGKLAANVRQRAEEQPATHDTAATTPHDAEVQTAKQEDEEKHVEQHGTSPTVPVDIFASDNSKDTSDDTSHVEPEATADKSQDGTKITDDTQHAAASTTEELPSRELVLTNARDSGGVVRYLINDREYSLSPGESQRLPAGTAWQVRYHRGGNFGNTSQTLDVGDYEFRVTDSGWQLEPFAAPQHSIGHGAE